MTEETRWVAIAERLPEVRYSDDGSVNCVLAFFRPGRLASYLPNPQVCNTVYLTKNASEFTHWMPLPADPE